MADLAASSKKKPRGKAFSKGQSGNPRGRPKMTSEEFELIAACKQRAPKALEVIERIMETGQSEKTKLSAAIAIIERAYGKPVQQTELSGPNGGPIEQVVSQRPQLSKEEWLAAHGITEK